MDISLFLAKVFGVYLMVASIAVTLRRKELVPAIEQLFDNRPLVLIMSIFALVVGILLVVSHNVWVAGWPVVRPALRPAAHSLRATGRTTSGGGRARAGADPWVRCRERKEPRAVPIKAEPL